MSDNHQAYPQNVPGVYAILGQFANIDAIYQRGEELIIKITPLIPREEWQDQVARQAGILGFHLVFFQEQDRLLAVIRNIHPRKKRFPWLNLVLFILTFFSIIIAYSYMEFGDRIFHELKLTLGGLHFALALMPILLCHEFGHYLAARRHKADVSLPYFIPAPTLIGTLGAVIKSRSPFRNRKQLFDVGAAGPLAGFVATVLILIIGFSTASLEKIPEPMPDSPLIVVGESIAFKILKIIFAAPIPVGYQVSLTPVVFAGWVGLFVTMLNLMPVGQLDGGHIVYALLGKKMQYWLALIVVGALVILGIWWPGWLIWAFLTVIITRLKHPSTLDDGYPLDRARIILGWTSIGLFILTFMPVPLGIVTS